MLKISMESDIILKMYQILNNFFNKDKNISKVYSLYFLVKLYLENQTVLLNSAEIFKGYDA